LDVLSQGRVTVVAGVGWVKEEFDALGYSFHDRGRRMDEILQVLRASWQEDPTSYDGTYHRFGPIRVLPKPAHPIPIWIGGSSEAAYARAIRAGDGFQFVFMSAVAVREPIARLRAARPERDFSISLRTIWDPKRPEALVRARDEYAEVGVQHLVIEQLCDDSDAWFEALDALASVLVIPTPA
jgi:alkanesulfonate monooxygenase SsuD/methylene tetrahydromethanopterin reductase-like flavin-dependent oxidoreductase (luciferase family)